MTKKLAGLLRMDLVTMVKKLTCLSRMRLCHNGTKTPVSVKKKRRRKVVSKINLRPPACSSAWQLPCLSRIKEEEKLLVI